VKAVLCGPPQSGKSVMREGLKQAIRAVPNAPYPYIITGCPDGEGAWFQETMNQDPELAKACKAAYKGKFTPEFVRRVAASVQNCALPLTIVDIGGIPSQENKEICKGATHAILLAGNSPKTGEIWSDRLIPWREFCCELGLTVVAEVFSDYHGAEDKVEGVGLDGVLRGSVHHLERGELVADRPMIKALARHLVALASV
jgi:CRISPR-associated protein Csx3